MAEEDVTRSPLEEEHALLGASLDQAGRATSYATVDDELAAFTEGCALCDVWGAYSLLMEGEKAEAFVDATCAGTPLDAGDAALEAVLSGDGSVIGVPIVARMGASEFVLWDMTPRAEALDAWLSFVQGIEQKGVAPYADVNCEDVTGGLAPLLLWGPAATRVLGDYLGAGVEPPEPGHVSTPKLDGRIASVIVRTAAVPDALLVCVPHEVARVLWRSLMSFMEVTPVGTEALRAHACQQLPWAASLVADDRVDLAKDVLVSAGLVRTTGGFIGQRGLDSAR